MKKTIIILVVIVIAGLGYTFFTKKIQTSSTETTSSGKHCGGNMTNAPTCQVGYHCAPEPGSHLPFGDVGGICVPNAGDYKYATYMIEDQSITLVNGSAENPAAPGSDSIVSTDIFGDEVRGDFNGDGLPDIAFLLTQDGGGTGVFYYLAAALGSKDGFKGINAVFIGDRIAPQTTEFKNGQIIVNYADRKPDEPYSANPSVGVSKYFKVSGNKLIEVTK
jgi:hypothetical protein